MKRLIAILCSLALISFSVPVFAQPLTIYSEEWAPISFTSDHQPTGLAVEIVQEIQKRINTQEPIQIVPWARGWTIMTKQPNTVLFAMTKTVDREKLFTLVGPIAAGTVNFYTLQNSQITISSLEDAKHAKAIGVYRESVEEQTLKEHGFENIATTSTPLFSAKQLLKQRIDIWCNTNLTTTSILREAGAPPDAVKSIFTLSDNLLYIAFSKGTSEEVIEQWQTTLDAMKQDGTFASIYQKWLPNENPPMWTERLGGNFQ
ncbi:substrate-binding periplasmic protein [Shewanella acanthi]|uniref:substrate-binding periplasmic protein n=1 Tax=Shewanella acanthi TaxID=2864212 RepID=UPI001C65EACA|nr:ABC transporter substrate-binding protein [Shewanella acanthi]QYJ79626.1 ABC transporter substrate-binding protein [Shewanella acanthi]